MGAWGPGLYQDDVAVDVKTDYVNLLKIGKTNQDATDKMIEDNHLIIDDFDSAPIFWFALADTQWKLGRLLPNVKDKALIYLKNEDDLKKWKTENRASYKYRKKVLDELFQRLNSPMPTIKKISLYKYFKCSWNVGDTYAFRLESEHAKQNNLFGHYLIIHKIDEYHWKKGNEFDTFPIVYTKITKTSKLPNSVDELNNDCDFVRVVYNPGTGLYRYKTINDTNSSMILKKLVFVGNFALQSPKDEYVNKDLFYPIDIIKSIRYEKEKINSYVKFANRQ